MEYLVEMVQQAACNLGVGIETEMTTLVSAASGPVEVQGVKKITQGQSHSMHYKIKRALKIKSWVERGCQHLRNGQEPEKKLVDFYVSDWEGER